MSHSNSKKRAYGEASKSGDFSMPESVSKKSKKAKDELEEENDPNQPKLEDWDEGDLQVEFVLESLQDDDYFMMKNLLKGFLTDTSYNSGELCDLVLAQKDQIGSAITVVGQEDSFGFMSILDVQANWDKPSIQSTLKYVIGKVGTSSQIDEWKKILTKPDSGVGLILSERIPNLPDHLAPHLNLITFQELAAMKGAPKYKYFLIITNCYRQGEDDSLKQAGGGTGSLDPTIHYYKPEDEIYKECCLLSHATRIVKNNQLNRWTLHMYTQQSKLFMLVAADQLPRILKKLKEMANEIEEDLRSKQATKQGKKK